MKAHVPPTLTVKERRYLQDACNAALRERMDKLTTYCDAMMLLSIHKHLGYGPKRCRRVWRGMYQDYKAFMDRYKLDPDGAGWYVLERCKTELGIDVDELAKEMAEVIDP